MTQNFDKQNYGIYGITNTVTGKMYIGQTSHPFHARWRDHRNNLKKNKHHNQHLQYAWNKYDEKAFRFDALEVGPTGLSEEDRLAWCNKKEEYWIGDSYLSSDYYNMQSGGNNAIPGPETRRKRSATLKANPPFKGRKHTEKAKQLLREARLRQENVFTKPVIWIDQDGNKHKFESQVDACKQLGIKMPTMTKAINRGGFSNHGNTMPHLRGTKLMRGE